MAETQTQTKVCSPVQKSVEWCEGASNYAGIRRRALYTAASNITKWPTRKTLANGAELAEYVDKENFTLKADKKWYAVDMLPAKSKYTSDPNGELPSASQLNKLELVIPHAGQEASNMAAYINNIPCVWLVEDMDGNWRVIGCERWAGEIKNTIALDLGQGAAGTAQSTITVEAPDTTPAPLYAGEIDEDVVTEAVA